MSPLILKTEYHLSRASAAAAGHFFMFTLSFVPFAWPARGEVSPPAGGEDGGYFAAPAASDFANSGKVTKAPFRNLRFLKISLRWSGMLACVLTSDAQTQIEKPFASPPAAARGQKSVPAAFPCFNGAPAGCPRAATWGRPYGGTPVRSLSLRGGPQARRGNPSLRPKRNGFPRPLRGLGMTGRAHNVRPYKRRGPHKFLTPNS